MNSDCKLLRKRVLSAAFSAGEGHVPSSFSVIEIIYIVYRDFMSTNSIFVLSKGHASLAWYAVLESFEVIPDSWMDSFCKFESNLGGHPDSTKIPGVVCSTGSLGHGLPFSVGLALGKKIKSQPGEVYCLIGDGEANEGTIWESALIASHHSLANLTCIIDFNKSSDRALSLGDIGKKFESFGWDVIEVDGHDLLELSNALSKEVIRPKVIIANTVKGYGLKRMENNPAWHHTKIPEQIFQELLLELN